MTTNNWTPDQPIVSVKDVHKSFGKLEVLKGINFDVMKGEVICIIGPSGSGKSTLIRCINALNGINSGSIKVHGLEVNDPNLNKLELRKNVGMVFQQYNLSLNGKPMNFANYVQTAFSQGLSPDGIFGVNILINQFNHLMERKVNILGIKFDKIYLLQRKNKLKQAYSLMKSQKTFIFTSDILEEAQKKYGEIEVEADEVHFSLCLSKILREEAYIKRMLDGLSFEQIYFEEIISDNFANSVKSIKSDLGLKLRDYISPIPSIMSNRSDTYVYAEILRKIGLGG